MGRLIYRARVFEIIFAQDSTGVIDDCYINIFLNKKTKFVWVKSQ